MAKYEFLINMLQKDPDLYKILNSKPHLEILEEISKKPILFKDLQIKIYFKRVSMLYNILDMLIEKEFIKKIVLSDKETYYITETGNKFIQNYKASKEELNLI